RRIDFDLTTDRGLDGFDFHTDATNVRFKLLMDNKERPQLVFIGARGANPNTVPFIMHNPEARPPAAALVTLGKPHGMGPGSPHRYLVWREKNGLWHVRTTT